MSIGFPIAIIIISTIIIVIELVRMAMGKREGLTKGKQLRLILALLVFLIKLGTLHSPPRGREDSPSFSRAPEKSRSESFTGWIPIGLYDKETKKWDVSYVVNRTGEEIDIEGKDPFEVVMDSLDGGMIYTVKKDLSIRVKSEKHGPNLPGYYSISNNYSPSESVFVELVKTGERLPEGDYVGLIADVNFQPRPDFNRRGEKSGKVWVMAEFSLSKAPWVKN
ncbi:MAG: hypothetical protein ACFCA4_16995 [Cyanophyceae cyanobacterium]